MAKVCLEMLAAKKRKKTHTIDTAAAACARSVSAKDTAIRPSSAGTSGTHDALSGWSFIKTAGGKSKASAGALVPDAGVLYSGMAKDLLIWNLLLAKVVEVLNLLLFSLFQTRGRPGPKMVFSKSSPACQKGSSTSWAGSTLGTRGAKGCNMQLTADRLSK